MHVPGYAMSLNINWPRPLQHRRGGWTRLDGLDVYYDFDWFEQFQHRRMQFKNGQILAQDVRAACPADKRPALLLTTRKKVREQVIETDSDFIVVLNLPRYLREATGDAAVSYWARNLGIGRLSQFADVSPDEIRTFLEFHLTAERVGEWVAADGSRIAALRRLPEFASDTGIAGPADVVAALEALGGLDEAIVTALSELLGREAEKENRLRLLRALTEDAPKRYETGEVFSGRATERLGDARQAVAEYSALIADTSSSETDVQHFLEQNLWLLGLDYAAMHHRRPLPRGEMDFILERFDGFHDVLELKNPQDAIVTGPQGGDMPPSASAYALTPVLAGALAQVHV
jgi:hypothetical protein